MPAAPPPPAVPAVLIDDLVEKFLLALPPEDPASLVRAALVSKQWHRIITGPHFRREYRQLHRRSAPPLLGYIVNFRDYIRFVSMSSFRPRHAARHDVRAIHASHGRVLLQRLQRPSEEDKDLNVFQLLHRDDLDVLLSVWDPITDEQRDLPVLACPYTTVFWDAAVVCATVGDGCDHLDCHLKVVFVGVSQLRNFSCFYSSETDSWSDPIFTLEENCICFVTGAGVLAGSALYFRSGGSNEILKYDVPTNQMCMMTIQHDNPQFFGGVLIATEDGRVGVAKTISSKLLMLSSREHGRWAQSRVIELHRLLPDQPWVIGFAQTGAGGVIFLKTHLGYFTIDLNSGRSKKVGEILHSGGGSIVPYVSFCTPGPVPGAVSRDDVPVAAVAVSTDDRVGNGVEVCTDEGPGA